MRAYAEKPDSAQEAIVSGLRAAYVEVWIIRKPCDLLCRFYSARRREKIWQTLEVKTPTVTGKQRKRRDQQKQDEFLALTATPVVKTLDEALQALSAA